MSETKTITISGSAATDLSGGKRKRSYTKKQGGGEAPKPIINEVINAVKGFESPSPMTANAGSANSNTWLKPIINLVPPQIQPTPSHPLTLSAPAPIQQGGATKHIRVELKKKITTKKVHLNPKKPEVLKHASKKHQTKKARKITLGIVSLHKRITHAKKLHKKVKEMPIEALKEKLIKSGLIKASSKAPESVLRQIAADAAVVKNKAL